MDDVSPGAVAALLGTALAEDLHVLQTNHQPQDARLGLLQDAHLSRYARAKPLVLAGYYLALVGLLVASGYPTWRVVGAGCRGTGWVDFPAE